MRFSHLLLASLLLAPGMAKAEMPIFSAKCLENMVDADRSGAVRVNGLVVDVTAFNENYYEATIESMTYSISHDGGGSGLIVTFTGSGGVNGICQVLAAETSADGDDGGGAMAESGMGAGETRTETVHFQKGASSATMTTDIAPGGSVRYVLGANAGQDLYVTMGTATDGVSYQIFNPDSTFLLDMVPFTTEYRGELWQSGDHVVEVINRSNENAYVTVTMSID
ncbi:hypothetical protein ACSBLW_16170 [Thioclava sp. FR2]|uniref:hypothetical protein n=1 Tax=Thioclava sp. FR2 TaxID=3445780 RepID=UPI003EB8CEB4